VFDRILSDVPATREGVTQWLRTAYGIDQYLGGLLRDEGYVTWPSLASQPSILAQELDELRPRYA
jgi:hypothetical protein